MAKISDDRTEEVNEEIISALERAFTVIGLEASGYASALSPVDTGRLRSSLTFKVDGNSKGVTIGTNVEYAPYQEFGTSKMTASPFLRPAIENHLTEYENVLRTELGEVQ